MAFNLAAIHDINTGIILTLLVIAIIKCYLNRNHAFIGSIVLALFILSILPTPFHGTGILGIIALLTTYIFTYMIWGKKQEVTYYLLAALVIMMVNIVLGLKLRGIL